MQLLTESNEQSQQIIGIDPGLTKTGIAILQYQNRSFTLLKTQTVSTTPSTLLAKRIFIICETLKTLLNTLPQNTLSTNNNLIGIETSFVHVNKKNYEASIKLANVYGAMLYTIQQYTTAHNHSHLIEIPPNKIKKYTTGAGHSDKKSIHLFLSRIIKNYKTNNLHESDAIAIAYTAGLILTNRLLS